MPAIQLTRTMVSDSMNSQGSSQPRKAGRIEMKAIEMPARVPSIAARGVYFRTVGPTKAPKSTMAPMTRHHTSPDCHASSGSCVFK